MNAANLIDHIASITAVTGAPGIAIALCYLIYTIKHDRLHAENRAFFLGYQAAHHDAAAAVDEAADNPPQ